MLTIDKYFLTLIGFISFLVVLFTPYGFEIDIGPGHHRLLAIFWNIGCYKFLDGLQYWNIFPFTFFDLLRFIM
jgi:hypothetical protein